MNALRRLSPFSILIGAGVLGFLVITMLFLATQISPLAPELRAARSHAIIGPTDKLFIDTQSKTSELLFKISFAVFAGVLGLYFSGTRAKHLTSRLVSGALGVLFLGLYSAFLFNVGMAQVLEEPAHDMYGPILRFPIMCQFWCLLLALLLLAATFFREHQSRRHMAIAFIVSCILCHPALATERPAQELACLDAWQRSRHQTLSPETTTAALDLTGRLTALNKLKSGEGEACQYLDAVLDEVRYTALADAPAGASEEASLTAAVRSLDLSTRQPQFNWSDALQSLLRVGEIYRAEHAVLEIEAIPGSKIDVVEIHHAQLDWKRSAPCMLILSPGKYRVLVWVSKANPSQEIVELADGERRVITVRSGVP